MDHPSATYGQEGSPHNAPTVLDPLDPSYDPDDPNAHPFPRRFGDNDDGSFSGDTPMGSDQGDGYFDSRYNSAREFGDSPNLGEEGDRVSQMPILTLDLFPITHNTVS